MLSKSLLVGMVVVVKSGGRCRGDFVRDGSRHRAEDLIVGAHANAIHKGLAKGIIYFLGRWKD